MSSEVQRQHAQERAKTQVPTDEELARLLLNESADYLEEGHWIRGRLRDGQGNFCAMGVLDYKARTGRKKRYSARIRQLAESMLARTIAPIAGSRDPVGTIVNYNDATNRRASTIIRKFRMAANQKSTD